MSRQRPRRPRRSVFVIGSAGLGGAEGQLTRLAVELAQRGEDVHVAFLSRGGPLTSRLSAAGVPWSVLAPQGIPSSTARMLVALVRLAWRFVRTSPDVAVAWLPGAIWPTLLLARVLSPRTRRLAGLRGGFDDADFRLTGPFLRSAVRGAHVVTVNSAALTPLATRWGAGPGRVRLLVNGVDRPPVLAHPEVEPPTAVVVANYRWYKGHDTLLHALALGRSDVRVRLCGEGDATQVRSTIAELGLGDRVHLVDVPADVPAELAAAQLAIHPSHQEGMSNAILEQVSCGLPVVATDVGATREMVHDGRNGFVVPPADPQALAVAIDRLACDPELRRTMGTASLEVGDRFTWPQCAAAYLALFDEVTGVAR